MTFTGLKRDAVSSQPIARGTASPECDSPAGPPISAVERIVEDAQRGYRPIPTSVCDGWTEPRHPRKVLRRGDERISHGMCPECEREMMR